MGASCESRPTDSEAKGVPGFSVRLRCGGKVVAELRTLGFGAHDHFCPNLHNGGRQRCFVSSFVKRIQPGLGCERALFALEDQWQPQGPPQPAVGRAQQAEGPRWAGLLLRRRLAAPGSRFGLASRMPRGTGAMRFPAQSCAAQLSWRRPSGAVTPERPCTDPDPVRNLRLR